MEIKQKLIARGFNKNGKLERECSQSEFETITGVALESSSFESNEYGTQDVRVYIVDEEGEEFYLDLEIGEDGFITHCYHDGMVF